MTNHTRRRNCASARAAVDRNPDSSEERINMSTSNAVRRSRAQLSMPLLRLFSLLLIVSLLLLHAGAFAATEQAAANAVQITNKVILFASEGMRVELVEK